MESKVRLLLFDKEPGESSLRAMNMRYDCVARFQGPSGAVQYLNGLKTNLNGLKTNLCLNNWNTRVIRKVLKFKFKHSEAHFGLG